MRVFITGVNGQLGHDCVNEMSKRGHEVIGSDIQKSDGVQTQGGGAQASKPAYVSLDITDAEAGENCILQEVSRIHISGIICREFSRLWVTVCNTWDMLI